MINMRKDNLKLFFWVVAPLGIESRTNLFILLSIINRNLQTKANKWQFDYVLKAHSDAASCLRENITRERDWIILQHRHKATLSHRVIALVPGTALKGFAFPFLFDRPSRYRTRYHNKSFKFCLYWCVWEITIAIKLQMYNISKISKILDNCKFLLRTLRTNIHKKHNTRLLKCKRIYEVVKVKKLISN